MEKICCAFGHREVFEDVREKLYGFVKQAAKEGYRYFYTGGMGDFDRMFSHAVKRVQSAGGDVRLVCIKPYFTNAINANGRQFTELYDDIIIPAELAGLHYKTAIEARNRWMIDRSKTVLFYLKRNYGGTFTACKYAKAAGKIIKMI